MAAILTAQPQAIARRKERGKNAGNGVGDGWMATKQVAERSTQWNKALDKRQTAINQQLQQALTKQAQRTATV